MKKSLQNIICLLLITTIFFTSCKRQLHFPNQPPIANAGRDTSIILTLNAAILDGSGSKDPDNNISSYAWRKISGPSSNTIVNANAAKTAVNNLSAGIYQFELKVTDDGGLFAKDTVMISVTTTSAPVTPNIPVTPVTNQPPVAKAGDNQVHIISANAVTLDGSASFDRDGKIVSYLWTKINGPAGETIANAQLMTTTVSGLIVGVYNFRLEVVDNMGAVAADTSQIEIINVLTGTERIYKSGWSYNDLHNDSDVYWDSDPEPGNLYDDTTVALQVSILLDTSANSTAAWIDVKKRDRPLSDTYQFYWYVERGLLWIQANRSGLIGIPLTVKVKFL